MSDLPTPINRHEQYLNAIANGTTDNLPTPPITREEVFLDYIARNGGGGGGDVTGVKGNAESTYRKGNVNITPENIGLGNVNNTSDAQKPVSTATQEALDLKANVADVNIFHGTADDWDNLPLSEKVKYTDAMIEGQNSNNPVGNLNALTTTDKSSCVGAINELNGGVIASVTADGVKTYSALFDELYALLSNATILYPNRLKITLFGGTFQVSSNNQFYRTYTQNDGTISTLAIMLNASGSTYRQISVNTSGTSSYMSLDSNVVSNGTVISVIY